MEFANALEVFDILDELGVLQIRVWARFRVMRVKVRVRIRVRGLDILNELGASFDRLSAKVWTNDYRM